MELVKEFWDANTPTTTSITTPRTSATRTTTAATTTRRPIDDFGRSASSSAGPASSWAREALAAQASTRLRSMLSILNAQSSQGPALDSSVPHALPSDILVLSREPAIGVADLTIDPRDADDMPEPQPKLVSTASARERGASVLEDTESLREKVKLLLNECKRLQAKLTQEKASSTYLDTHIDRLTSQIANEHRKRALFTSLRKSHNLTTTSSTATTLISLDPADDSQYHDIIADAPLDITNTGDWVVDQVYKHSHAIAQLNASTADLTHLRNEMNAVDVLGQALLETRQTLLHVTKPPTASFADAGVDDNISELDSDNNNDDDNDTTDGNNNNNNNNNNGEDSDAYHSKRADDEKSSIDTSLFALATDDSNNDNSYSSLSPTEQWRIVLHRIKTCKREIVAVQKENQTIEAGNCELQGLNANVQEAFEKMMGTLETVSRCEVGHAQLQVGKAKQSRVSLRAPKLPFGRRSKKSPSATKSTS